MIRRFPECLRKAPEQRLGRVMCVCPWRRAQTGQMQCNVLTVMSNTEVLVQKEVQTAWRDGKCCGMLLVRILVHLHHFPSHSPPDCRLLHHCQQSTHPGSDKSCSDLTMFHCHSATPQYPLSIQLMFSALHRAMFRSKVKLSF